MSRPRIELTPEQAKEVETLASVLTLEQIADYFGIDADTFVAIRKRDPEVFRYYKKGRAKAVITIGGNLINQAKSGNTAAAIFYLKTQAGWRETADVNASAQVSEVVFTRAKRED